MNIKILGAIAAVALLAACSTPPAPTPAAQAAAPMTAGPIPGSEEDLVANVGDRIFYDFDKSNINGTGSRTTSNMATLDKQVAWLAKYPQVNLQVAGNCDERGTEDYNLALGQKRASADANYLMAKGVAKARVTTISYGKDRPVALGSNEDSWSQNRNAITSVK
jgi:peptidoglycan-associated lipoprotein